MLFRYALRGAELDLEELSKRWCVYMVCMVFKENLAMFCLFGYVFSIPYVLIEWRLFVHMYALTESYCSPTSLIVVVDDYTAAPESR